MSGGGILVRGTSGTTVKSWTTALKASRMYWGTSGDEPEITGESRKTSAETKVKSRSPRMHSKE